MIVPIFGTTGELIKIAPILRKLDERKLEYLTVSTNQHATQIPAWQRDLGLRPTDVELAQGRKGRDLERFGDILPWMGAVTAGFLRERARLSERLRGTPGRHVALVHGDTLTTVLGAGMGRILGLPVAHLEAGMRSGDWRNPFPEELDRRAAGFFAVIHYANTDREMKNLRRARGEAIEIGANTVMDSLKLVPDGRDALGELLGPSILNGPYGIISLHRTELLRSGGRLRAILETVSSANLAMPLLFVDHPVTIAALRALGLENCLEGMTRVPRLRYTAFIALLRGSEFLVTDSGGNQEECYFLDVPCLVHRLVTERTEGLGRNVVLSRYDLSVVRDFLRDPGRWRMGERPELPSPSDLVIADLLRRGVWNPC